MASTRGIPIELLNFFQTPGGHSVIVKGVAGTGKTTFALQLTEELGGINTSYYMSTRVSDTSLYNQFPWLKERVKATGTTVAGKHYTKTLIEDPVLEEEGMQVSLEVRVLSEKESERPKRVTDKRVDRSELQKLEGRIEMGEEGDESYPTVGEGEVTESSLVFDLGSDLPEIDMAYDAVERNLPLRTLVVIDSIDALSERYGLQASKLINTLQKDLVENSKANVLYVLEASGNTKLDYLGDGVISFKGEYYAGRRLRIMEIEKLRGSEIRQHRYLYTLDGGRLRAFEVSQHQRPNVADTWRAISDTSKDRVSTGFAALDTLFGGLKPGGSLLLEVGAHVPVQIIDEFRTGLICNFAMLNRGVAHVPPGKLSAENVKQMVAPYLNDGIFDEHVRIFESTPIGTLEESSIVIHMEGANADTDLKWNNVQYRLPKVKSPILSLMAFDTLESVYGSNVLEELTAHMSTVKRRRDVFLGMCTSTTVSNRKLADLSDVHVKVENIDGAVLIYCEKPFTELHHLRFDYMNGFPQIVLSPIV